MKLNYLTHKLWIQLLFIVFVCLVPMSFIFNSLIKESNQILLSNEEQIINQLRNYEGLLKKIASFDNTNSDVYKKYFFESNELRNKLSDEYKFSEILRANIVRQTFIWMIAVFLTSILIAWFLSRKIVSDFKLILTQHQVNIEKINSLSNIENWQNTAKIIIHEIKTPLTPIKMVLTSLIDKLNSVPEDDLNSKVTTSELNEGLSLCLTQSDSLEKWIYSFTEFAKLPAPDLKNQNLLNFLNEFKQNIQSQYMISKPKVEIEIISTSLNYSVYESYFDAHLIYNLLFNLIKNGIEANADKDKILFRISINLNLNSNCIDLTINNFGNLIPINLEDKIFDLAVSAKKGNFSRNLGVGLTVCKKIAMDHGGDINLISNSEDMGVTFSFNLPRQRRLL